METYVVIQNVIRVSPFLILLALFVYLLRYKWYWRFGAMIAIGWVMMVVSVNLYWSYAIQYAPTTEMAIELSQKDSGPRAMVLLFGWFIGAMIGVFLEILRGCYRGFQALGRKSIWSN